MCLQNVIRKPWARKLGDTGLDDLLNEAQFSLRDDGRRLALLLLLLRLITWLYRALKTVISAPLRIRWHRGALMPSPGAEPFSPSDSELEREWRHQG